MENPSLKRKSNSANDGAKTKSRKLSGPVTKSQKSATDKSKQKSAKKLQISTTDVIKLTSKQQQADPQEVEAEKFPSWSSVINDEFTTSYDFVISALDDIALEGLEGISLEILWARLLKSLRLPWISTSFLQFIWRNLKQTSEIAGFLLDTPIQAPIANLRIDYISEPNVHIVYSHVPISTKEILGSCSTFNQRKPYEFGALTLHEATELGNCALYVASQKLRFNSLVWMYAEPLLELSDQQYYLLERIGRSRYVGETTTGDNSLAMIIKDPKTLFYYKRYLHETSLVAKQNCRMRTKKNTSGVGALMHLRRFYREIKSTRQLVIEYIISLIKQKPTLRMEYMELRRLIGPAWDEFKMPKVLKSAEFRQFVRTDVSLPYRVMYPNATQSEWKQKAKELEKSVRVLELRNPNLNTNSIFREDIDDDDAASAHSDSDSEAEDACALDAMTMQRIYRRIHAAGAAGTTLRRVSCKTRTEHYIARKSCNALIKRGLLKNRIEDEKRQHFMVYVASAHINSGRPASGVTIVTDVDQDALDFVSKTLGTNSVALASTEPSTDVCMTNIIKRSPPTYNEYFHIPLATIPSSTPSPDASTTKFFTALTSRARSTPHFRPQFRFDLKTKLHCKQLARSAAPPTYRKCNTFKPFHCLIQNLYTFKNRAHYKQVAAEAAVNNYVLSSSEEEELEEIGSDESICNGLTGVRLEKVADDVKKVLIDSFQKQGTSLEGLFGPSEPNAVAIPEPPPELSADSYYSIGMEVFMGPKPSVILSSRDAQGVDTMVVSSTAPADFGDMRAFVGNSHRMRSRIKIIKDAVSSAKLIIDMIKVQAMVVQTERAGGTDGTMDRKSMYRIFAHMVREGFFRVLKIILRIGNVVRSKNMIVMPKYDVNALQLSIIDQFKSNFLIYAKRKSCAAEAGAATPAVCKRRYRYNRMIGRSYGFSPKVNRMRTLHEFLFYVTRDYSGAPITRDETRHVLMHYCDGVEDLMSEATTIYQRTANWKMFVPPLPVHSTHPTGWALVSDILLRLPLVLFVKLSNIAFVIPELPSYLNHPIRRYYLVKNLPTPIKDALFRNRKYIYAVHEILCFLAYVGLLQFGPQKLREKDQVFIYFNKKAILYDTTSSASGYHEVSSKEYPRHEYDFNSVEDVSKYWAELYFFSVHTKLGLRSSVIGQSITLQYVHTKPQLLETLQSTSPEEATQRDVGYLPGDGQGACCADSALWLHVKRNWFWCTKTARADGGNQQAIGAQRGKHLNEVKQIKLSDVYNQKSGKKFRVMSFDDKHLLKKKKQQHRKYRELQRNKVILRKVKPRKHLRPVRGRVDTTDRTILDRMGKSRATFNEQEDKLILICMACVEYLTSLNVKRSIASTAIRDFIHLTMPSSNKTSYAYRRRGMQLKKKKRLRSLDEEYYLSKSCTDYFTQKHFGMIRESLRRGSGRTTNELYLNTAFLYLAYYTYKTYTSMRAPVDMNDPYELASLLTTETMKRYQPPDNKESGIFVDPISEEDIMLDTVQSVLYSALGTKTTKHEWPFQLLRIYQSFSEDALRQSLLYLRDHQIISGSKLKTRKDTLLVAGIAYNLSFTYTFKQITQYPHCIYTDANDICDQMLNCWQQFTADGFMLQTFEQGYGLAISELQCNALINYIYDVPEDIIALNPNYSDFSDLVTELTRRYAILFKSNNENDFVHCDPIAIKQLENLRGAAEEDAKSASKLLASTSRQILESIEEAKNASTDGNDSPKASVSKSAETKVFSKTDRRHKSLRISDMALMLTKGLFPELDDDDRLDKLNEHFIVRYPSCRLQWASSGDRSEDAILCSWREEVAAIAARILQRIVRDAFVPKHVAKHERASALAAFIYQRQGFGATSKDLQSQFPNLDVCDLQFLIDERVVLRAGIASFAFVHHHFRHNWTIDLNTENYPHATKYPTGSRLRVAPWIQVNGALQVPMFEKWLSVLLSHCLSCPYVTFDQLCIRFNILKPVDVFHILEMLEQLQCLKMWTYVRRWTDCLFSDFDLIDRVPTSMLDSFEDIFIEVHSSAISRFSAFLFYNKSQNDVMPLPDSGE